MAQPVFFQTGFWGREDDGSESTATFKGSQSSNFSQAVDTKFRVRFLVDEQNSKAWSNVSFNLYYQINGGGYSAVTDTSPIQYTSSLNYTSGTNTVSRLSGGVGTFLSGNAGMVHSTATVTNSGAINQYFEAEYCLLIDSAQVTNGDTINLEIYSGATAMDSYPSVPTITVSETTIYQQSNAGSETDSGTLIKKTSKILSGISSFVGDLAKKTYTILDGAFSSSGTLVVSKFFARLFEGSMNSSGTVSFKILKLLLGSFDSSGNITKTTSKILSGTSAFVGDLSKKIQEFLDGNFTSSGTLFLRKFFSKLLSGSMDSSGITTRAIFKLLSGNETPTSNVSKKIFKFLDGVFNSSGILLLRKFFSQFNSGSMNSSGIIIKKTNKFFLGSYDSNGVIAKKVIKFFDGSMGSSGILNALKLARKYYQSLTGSETSTGSIYLLTKKIFFGTMDSVGSVFKKIFEFLSGDMSSSGLLNALKLGSKFYQSISGSMNSSGEVVRRVGKTLLGSSNFSGDILKRISKTLEGQMDSSGIISYFKILFLNLFGSFDSSGNVYKKTKLTIYGILGSSGTVKKKTRKFFSGLSDFIGTVLEYLVIDVLHGKAKLTIYGKKRYMGRKDIFDIGDAVRTKIEFRNPSGDLDDPTTVTFKYKVKKTGTPVVYVYGTDAEVVRESQGVYYCDILVASSDPHYVSFIGEGGLDAVEEDVFYVNNSYFE